MMNCCLPVRPRQWLPLSIRDRDQRHVAKFTVQRNQIRNVEAPMQRCNLRYRLPPAQWKMHVIQMKMNDVEIGRAGENTFEHDQVVGQLVVAMLIESQRPREI